MTDARTITEVLGGTWHGTYGTAPCPVCQPDRRSDQRALSLTNSGRRLLAFCHKLGCSFQDILAAAGLPQGCSEAPVPKLSVRRQIEIKANEMNRSAQALRLWNETSPIADSIAQTYLRGRSIRLVLPPTLRFHPSCWHEKAENNPALVAIAQGSAGFSVHRTYLRPDGTGKADVSPNKKSLGPIGGGAVHLSVGTGPIVVGEGLETSLSLLQGIQIEEARVWAALSAGGMAALNLPEGVGEILIAPDGDEVGAKAADRLAIRASRLGWRVLMMPPPGDGLDWNDVLNGARNEDNA